MAYDIGPRIGIEGEKEFRDAIGQINTTMKTLGTEMNAVTSAYDKNDKSVEALTAQNEVLNKQVDTQKQKLEELKKGLAMAAEKYGENHKVTQGWQQAVNQATSELNKQEGALSENEKALNDVKRGFNDAGQKLDEFGQIAEKSDNKLKGLGSALASAGEIAAKAAAAIGAAAVAAGSALVGMSVSGAKYADDLITLSSTTGIATDKLQEYKYASELVDVSVETLTGSMTKNIKSMQSAAQGSKNIADAYAQLGVEYKNADGTLRDGQEVYWEIIDSLGKMENETQRDALAMQILGRSARDLNPLIEAGASTMQELGAQAREAGYVLGEDTLDAFGEFDDQLQYLSRGAEGAKNALGTVLLPVLTNLAGDGVDLLGQFTKGVMEADGDIGKMGEAIAGIIPEALNVIMDLLPQVVDVGLTIVMALFDGIVDNLPKIIDAAIDIVMTLLDAIIESLPKITDGAVQLVVSLVTGIVEALPKVIEAAIQLIMALALGLVGALPELIPVAIEAVVTLAKGLIDALPALIEAIPEIVETIVSVLIENLPLLIDAALQIIMALTVAIINNLPLIIESSIRIIGAMVTGIVGAIPTLLAVVPQLFASLVKAFKEIKWSELGINLINGVIDGVKNAAKNLANSVVNAAKNALDSVKGFLGIKSPSTVMRDQVGMMIGEGLIEGIEDSRKQVQRAMVGLENELNIKNAGALSVANKQLTPQVMFGIDYARMAAEMGIALYESFREVLKEYGGKNVVLVMEGRLVARTIMPFITAESERLGVVGR